MVSAVASPSGESPARFALPAGGEPPTCDTELLASSHERPTSSVGHRFLAIYQPVDGAFERPIAGAADQLARIDRSTYITVN
jgi:hypothetical protein